MHWNHRMTALAATTLLSMSVAVPAHAGPDAQERCNIGRARAMGSYFQCMSRKADSSYRAKCVNRLAAAWIQLQMNAGSTCTGPRWVDNLDGTATDNLTGFVWEKKTNLDDTINGADPHDADNVYDLSDDDADPTDNDGTAFSVFLAALNAGGGFASDNGWRLPNIAELYTTFTSGDCTVAPCTDPALGPVVIDDATHFGIYWSTSRHPVNLIGGDLAEETPRGGSGADRRDAYYVRAVKGGYSPF